MDIDDTKNVLNTENKNADEDRNVNTNINVNKTEKNDTTDENAYENKSLALDSKESTIFKENNKKKDENKVEKKRNTNITEEIELLKSAVDDPENLYSLIATDPQYYVGIIENYKQENLQNLFNLRVNRINNKLTLKFKLYPDDRWVEVGQFSESYNDEETFEEFVKHIEIELERPRKKRPKPGEKLTIDQIMDNSEVNRDHLNYENDNKQNNKQNKQQNSKNELSDIYQEAEKVRAIPNLPKLPHNMKKKSNKVPQYPNHEPQPQSLQTSTIPQFDVLLQSWLNHILEKIAEKIPQWLEFDKFIQIEPVVNNQNSQLLIQLRMESNNCPIYLKQNYHNFVKQLEKSENSQFYQRLKFYEPSIPNEFKDQYYQLMRDCLNKRANTNVYQTLFKPDFSHENICMKLNLSTGDKELLNKFNIDLLSEWNKLVKE